MKLFITVMDKLRLNILANELATDIREVYFLSCAFKFYKRDKLTHLLELENDY